MSGHLCVALELRAVDRGIQHMRNITGSIFLLIILLGVGCSSEQTEVADGAEPAPQPPGEVRSSAQSSPYDLQFIDTMIVHHQGAVDMASIAESRLQNGMLKALARTIPADQQREIKQLKAWRKQWYPDAPSAENMVMPGMGGSMMDMSHMKTMPAGPAYDAMFIDMMIPHHQGAVQMGENALAKAERPELKELSKRIIDAQTMEIEQMKKLRASLPNPPGSNVR